MSKSKIRKSKVMKKMSRCGRLFALSGIAFFAILFFCFVLLKSVPHARAGNLSDFLSGSGVITLESGTYDVNSSLVVPLGTTLNLKRGAMIRISAGATLSINGKIEDCLYQIFDDKNTDLSKGVKFGDGNMLEVRPEWWGAKADNNEGSLEKNATANVNAIDKAVHAHRNYEATIRLSSGIYGINRAIRLLGSTSLKGVSAPGMGGWNQGSIIRPPYSVSDPINLIEDTPFVSENQKVEISNVGLGGTYVYKAKNYLNFVHGIKNLTIRDCMFLEAGDRGIYLENAENVLIERNISVGGWKIGSVYVSGSNINLQHNEFPNGNSEYGVFLENCQNCVLNGNIPFGDAGIVNNLEKIVPTKSIHIKNSENVAVTSNRTENFDYGIFLEDSNAVTVQYNRNPGDHVWGIFVKGSSQNIEISQNRIENTGRIPSYAVSGWINWSDDSWKKFFVNPDDNYVVFKENFLELWNAEVASGNANQDSLNKIKLMWEKYVNGRDLVGFGINVEGSCAGCRIENNLILNGWKDRKIRVETESDEGTPNFQENYGVDMHSAFQILSSGSSPAVSISSSWKTANSSPVKITNFTKAPVGKEIFLLINDDNTTFDFSNNTNLQGNNGQDWKPAKGDHLRCKKEATFWSCSVFNNTGLASSIAKSSDLNQDSLVNVTDLGILMTDWLKTAAQAVNPRSDISGDGIVNVQDLGMMMSEWGG